MGPQLYIFSSCNPRIQKINKTHRARQKQRAFSLVRLFSFRKIPRTKCTKCAIIEPMGIYLNPGNDNFIDALNTGIYVDKTLLIDETNSRLGNSNFKFLCVARPRRFGKSIAGNMLAAAARTVGERREQTCVMGLSQKYRATLIILNLQVNSNLLKFKYEQRR